MIIYQETNEAALKVQNQVYWVGQPLIRQNQQISAPAGAPPVSDGRLLLINPPGLDGGFGTGVSL